MKSFRRQRGFTLLEILVAAMISGIIIFSAYQALTQAAKNRQRIEARFDRLQELQLAVRLLTKDLAQIQPRPVRDLVGQSQLAAVMTAGNDSGIEMTVGGYSNPLNLKRSQQQRIGYELDDNILFRSQWLVLDRTQGSLPVRRKLLEGIVSMTVRFMDGQLDWKESWPTEETQLRMLPKAIEFTIEVENLGLIRRVVEIAG